ncbi:MAG: DUF1638 domain-containing protein [Phycisphaerae bacterium]|jgi:hypothetical protein|nr:DUF1638 domain-containing protein [Phycisphaerae bacterium]
MTNFDQNPSSNTAKKITRLSQVTKKFKFIGCEIVYREACKLAAASPFRVDLEFLKKGLHDLKRQEMNQKIQAAIDAVPDDQDYQAILLGYARCNDGLAGITARNIPLVIPKAHDCITFFFGSRSAYQNYFDSHPGIYFHTTGWMERSDPNVPGSQGVMQQLGLDLTFDEMVEKYGRENAEFLFEEFGDTLKNYQGVCFIRMGTTDETPFIEMSKSVAGEQGWTFECRDGNLSLLERLINGQWDPEDFLIVKPGEKIVARNTPEILSSEPVNP